VIKQLNNQSLIVRYLLLSINTTISIKITTSMKNCLIMFFGHENFKRWNMHRITTGLTQSGNHILSHSALPLDRYIPPFVESKKERKND